MKEIIYLDTNIMNSMLAQLQEGLITSFSLEENSQESETEGQQSSRTKKAGINGRVKVDTGLLPGGGLHLGATLGNDGAEVTNESRTMLEGQKDILNKAFHDYALDLLMDKLIENGMLVHSGKFREGDLHLGESTYRFYDFDLLKKAMDYETMNEMMLAQISNSNLSYEESSSIVRNKKPTAKDRQNMEEAQKVVAAHKHTQPIVNTFKQLNSISSYASNLLKGLAVIKTGNMIGLIKKEYLRESSEALSFRTDKSRQVKFLVRVIGAKEMVFNGNNLAVINENDIDMIPNMMLDIILGSFKVIKRGDLIVTPIAIFYE